MHPSKGNKKMHPSKANNKTHPSKANNKTHPSKANNKTHPSKGNNKTHPSEANYSPPSEGSVVVSYRLAKRSIIFPKMICRKNKGFINSVSIISASLGFKIYAEIE
ncbi:MAG: glutamate-rich protein 5 [Planctomycetaceae bacterium]|jgi:hypothetical protein|nr:glutamate-rich protein 5 [Planctomycetaceae bacterium]